MLEQFRYESHFRFDFFGYSKHLFDVCCLHATKSSTLGCNNKAFFFSFWIIYGCECISTRNHLSTLQHPSIHHSAAMAFICLCVFGKLTKYRNRVMHWSLGGLCGVATASCSLEVWGTWNFQPICLPPWCPLRWRCRLKLLNKFCVCSENFSESRRALHAFFPSFILSSVSFLFAFQKKKKKKKQYPLCRTSGHFTENWHDFP